jgi:hypothetical protein
MARGHRTVVVLIAACDDAPRRTVSEPTREADAMAPRDVARSSTAPDPTLGNDFAAGPTTLTTDGDDLAGNAGVTARCVQLRYISETGVIRNTQLGAGCSVCAFGRPVSVNATTWNGAFGNNVVGRAYCRTTTSTVLVAGPATAIDPGGTLFGVASVVGTHYTACPCAASRRPSPTS